YTSFVYRNQNEKNYRTTALRDLDITLTDISSGALANKSSAEKKEVVFKIGHQQVVTADKLYNLNFDNIELVPSEKRVFVNSFSLVPRLNKSQFIQAVKAKKANYRYHFRFKGIAMNDIDFDRLFREQKLLI